MLLLRTPSPSLTGSTSKKRKCKENTLCDATEGGREVYFSEYSQSQKQDQDRDKDNNHQEKHKDKDQNKDKDKDQAQSRQRLHSQCISHIDRTIRLLDQQQEWLLNRARLAQIRARTQAQAKEQDQANVFYRIERGRTSTRRFIDRAQERRWQRARLVQRILASYTPDISGGRGRTHEWAIAVGALKMQIGRGFAFHAPIDTVTQWDVEY